MTPQRFRIVKHATASLFALVMAGLFVLGFDGLLRGMQKLAEAFAARPPAATAPPAEGPATPGVVPAFIVPPPGEAPAAPAPGERQEP